MYPIKHRGLFLCNQNKPSPAREEESQHFCFYLHIFGTVIQIQLWQQPHRKMWIQVRSMDGKTTHKIDGLSKLTKINELRELLIEKFEAQPEQQRLFYRGKQVCLVICIAYYYLWVVKSSSWLTVWFVSWVVRWSAQLRRHCLVVTLCHVCIYHRHVWFVNGILCNSYEGPWIQEFCTIMYHWQTTHALFT